MTNENLEIASELLSQIAESAKAGSALALGPQAVQNLHGLLGDLLRKTLPAEPEAPRKHPVDALKEYAEAAGLSLPPEREAEMRAICDEEVCAACGQPARTFEPTAPPSGNPILDEALNTLDIAIAPDADCSFTMQHIHFRDGRYYEWLCSCGHTTKIEHESALKPKTVACDLTIDSALADHVHKCIRPAEHNGDHEYGAAIPISKL